jgi:hypothetical protein
MGKKTLSQARLEECVDDELNFIECPECGDDDFDSSRGVSMHYGYNHEGSLAYLYRCEECGRLDFGNGKRNTFCSKWCEIYNKTGTFKHFDEDYLREQVEEQGKTVTEIADELDVGMKTVSKWVLEYEIGNKYPCPSCDKSFATKQSVSKHHHDKHDESIAGTYYNCDYCGEENWTPKSKGDPKYPKYCNDDCFGSDMEGEDNPNKSKERREKISQTMKENYEKGETQHSQRDREWMMENVINKRDNDYLYESDNIINGSLISKPVFVEETERTVRSSWEKEIDLLLHNSDLNYCYEPKRFDIGDRKYMPDFIVESEVVIEVKGYVSDGSVDKAEIFMDEYPDYTYLVLGSKIPCDEYVSWEERNEIINRLKEILR